jgi:hypothetical protein
VNEGEPIVASKPRTEAARAFQSLAAIYTGAGVPLAPTARENGAGSRLPAILQRSR